MSAGEFFKVRAGVILIKQEGGRDKVLLARQNNRDFWVFPGGTQEIDEGIEECAVREMKEETNLDVRVEKLLYIADFMHPERHVIDVFFLAAYVSGELEMETTENLNDIGWFSLEEVSQMRVEPVVALKKLLDDWNTGFTANGSVYLGKYGL